MNMKPIKDALLYMYLFETLLDLTRQRRENEKKAPLEKVETYHTIISFPVVCGGGGVGGPKPKSNPPDSYLFLSHESGFKYLQIL
jgi:hypothetical protein